MNTKFNISILALLLIGLAAIGYDVIIAEPFQKNSTGFKQVASKYKHTCALLESGKVRCWGYNHYGQLGYGHTDNIGDNEMPADSGDVNVGERVKQLATGSLHTCALLESGKVRCWGYNEYGHLGYGHTDNIGDNEIPADSGNVNMGGTVKQLAAGSNHTCALLESGKVRCWGKNNYGQLGYGHKNNIETPAGSDAVNVGGRVKQLAAGYSHTCALLLSGKVRCWGYNEYGHLGYGHWDNIGDNEMPADSGDVNVGGRVKQVTAGFWHTCALLESGKIRCWGSNTYGELGYGHKKKIRYNKAPADSGDVNVGGRVKQVTAGPSHTCALLETGKVRCWGHNKYGQLGYGHKNDTGAYETPAESGDVHVGGPVKQISVGEYFTCALFESGRVRCWGKNRIGQLGYGHQNTIGDNETPGISGEKVMPTGRNTAPLADCEIKANPTGSEKSLTLNWTSRNGVKAEVGPRQALSIIPPADIAAGTRSYKPHYAKSYSMKVWNHDGILARCSINIGKRGKAAPTASDSAYKIAPSASISGILRATNPARKSLSFTIKTRPRKGIVNITNAKTGAFTYKANSKFCGIDGFTFTVNDGNSNSNIATVRIQYNPPLVKQIAAGDHHTCALLESKKVRCWGSNERSQLGYGYTVEIGGFETQAGSGDVNIGGPVKQISGDLQHTCALLESGKVRCWGKNGDGQLGYGHRYRIEEKETPADAGDVDAGGKVKQITTGAAHTCALLESGKVRCWGFNKFGQLGYGNKDRIGDNETPASAGTVDVGGTVKQVSAGYSYTCALLESGKVRCWGENSWGALGYGHKKIIGDNEAPTRAGTVDVGGTVKQISAGFAHACVLLKSEKVRCWGYNQYGQLGYGHKNNIGDNETPAGSGDVNVGGTVKQIAAGGLHTCALLESGRVRCWGKNNYGQLGYGHKNNIGGNETPADSGYVNVGGMVKQITAGFSHTCALLESGKVRCWGSNIYGELGYRHSKYIGDNETPSGDVPL